MDDGEPRTGLMMITFIYICQPTSEDIKQHYLPYRRITCERSESLESGE